jgi:PLP dependent protein
MTHDLVSTIHERYQNAVSRIADAAAASGRNPKTVRVVVVSKSQPLEVIQAALEAGITVFGENYVDQALGKIAAINDTAVEWHMIGHIQSRKAAAVAENFNMVHSLDSIKLAGRLDHICGALNKILPVLLEFNVSGEESKFGFPAWDENHWSDLDPKIKQIMAFDHLHVRGLMTMPPLLDDPENTRPYFHRLNHLREYLAGRFPQAEWQELSMGTSVDYLAAVQEGATLVRIGQAILGPRPH